MWRLIIGVFLLLHGLVHLLYAGQSARLFELETGLTWPDGSWTFTRLLGATTTRALASTVFVLLAVGFVASGAGLMLRQPWWEPVVVVTAAAAVLFTLLFWDGRTQMLDGKGAIGLLISLAILVAVQVAHWPAFEF